MVHSLICFTLIRAVNFTSAFYKHCILLPYSSHTSVGILLFAVMHTIIFTGRSRTATDRPLPDSTCWGIPGHSRMPQLCRQWKVPESQVLDILGKSVAVLDICPGIFVFMLINYQIAITSERRCSSTTAVSAIYLRTTRQCSWGWAWASPTLARLHCTRVYIYVYACLLAIITWVHSNYQDQAHALSRWRAIISQSVAQRPAAETTEVEARMATYFSFVLLQIIHSRLLTGSANCGQSWFRVVEIASGKGHS